MSENRIDTGLEVAIIGMSGRFPGANSVSEFWQELTNDQEMVKKYSVEELSEQGLDERFLTENNFIGSVGKLENPEWFDSAYFGYSHLEAEVMDPQIRIMLECAQEALQDAGYNSFDYNGYIGVYTGASSNELWEAKTIFSGKEANLGQFETEFLKNKDFISAHISYRLNLKGPSLSTFTACSTSLTTVHLACQALLNGECDMALAGGVSVNLVETYGYSYQEGMILSKDGKCKPFDSDSSGTISSDGAGIVLLKSLDAALRDGDHIYATILASAINNDGTDKIGFTAPSLSGQVDLMKTTYQLAEIEPDTIAYIEAHGTATSLGDSIEFEALKQAFSTNKRQFCALGAVKSNVGHMDVAAGIGGLIKVALSLKNKKIPGTVHYSKPNEWCKLEESPFYLSASTLDWKEGSTPRRAALSSLGIGGSNVHIVLEEFKETAATPVSQPPLLLLSAKSSDSLSTMIDAYANCNLSEYASLQDMAFTLAYGRQVMPWRYAICAKNLSDAKTKWETYSAIDCAPALENPQLVFLISGQGTQYSGMYADLYQSDSIFKKAMDSCFVYLTNQRSLEMQEMLFETGHDEALKQTKNSQLALFITCYSLSQKLHEMAIKPDAMIGHSIGELVCACISGVLTLKDAIELVELRGQLMQQMPVGKMISVGLSEEKIQGYLLSGVSLAAVNTAELCVISGETDKIDELINELKEKRVFVKELHTSHAFHSHMMEDLLPAFQEKLNQISFKKASIPYLSNVTGNWITEADLTDATYWAKHLRQEVRFNQGLNHLLKSGAITFVEIGPGNTLCQLTKSNAFFSEQHRAIPLIRKKDDQRSDVEFLLEQLGKVWETGYTMSIETLIPKTGKRTSLPTYPFERERYWIDGSIEDWIQLSLPVADAVLPVEKWLNKMYWKRLDTYKYSEVIKSTSVIWFDFDNNLAVEKIIARMGKNSIHVKTDPTTNQIDTTFSIASDVKEDYLDFFQELKSQNHIPEHIIISLPVLGPKISELTEGMKFSLCLLFLVDSLSSVFPETAINIDVLTQNKYDIIGNESVEPLTSLAVGVLPVINQEYSKLSIRLTDLDQLSNKNTDLLAPWLLAKNRPSEIAVRNGQLWTKSYEMIDIDPAKKWNISTDDVYVITGGMGHVGQKLASYFAELGACTIYLIGRTIPDAGSTKMNQIDALRKQGSTIELRIADVSNENEFSAQLDAIYELEGKITGIVHAAANMNDCIQLIGTLDAKKIENIITPKIVGAQVIVNWSNEKQIDFIALTSSISTELGGLGYSAYAASNAFLDALALSKQNETTRWLTINWDGWQLEEETEFAIDSTSGKHLFGIILGQLSGQTIVSTSCFETRRKQWLQQENKPAKAYTDGKKHKRPSLITPYLAPATKLEQAIAEIWGNFFRIENLGINDDFFALGGDSLKGMMLVNRYKELMGEMIYVSVIFEATTIAQTAEYFHKHYANSAAKIDGIELISNTEIHSTISSVKVAEIKRLLPVFEINTSCEKNEKAVFIISSSRSGSTLLRVMLAGNPALFAPPELELMNYHLMEGGTEDFQGLIRSLMGVFDWDATKATQKVEQMIAERWTVNKVYQFLQTALKGQLLVEKTPSYSFNSSILERIEAEFENPIYIHLVRHPYGMINSKKNARLDLLRGELEQYFQSGQELAEFEWVLANQNCDAFLATIDKDRQLQLKYEDLVANPEAAAKDISNLIGIPFHSDMLNPYANDSKRMTDGVHEQSMMIGDPKFHTHRTIAKDNANTWRNDISADFLHVDTLQYAESFGYQSIANLNRQDWEQYVKSNRYPVSSQQRKLLIYQDIFANTTNYNIPRAIQVDQLHHDRIQMAVNQLTERHSILRTKFVKENGQYYQCIDQQVEVTVGWTILTNPDQEINILQSLVVPFDVSQAPLFSVHVIDRGNGQNVIFFDTHHVLTDAISQNLLIKELVDLYEGNELPSIIATYHEYAALQCSPAYCSKLTKQEAFWLSKFEKPVQVLKLETNFARPELLTFNGSEVILEIQKDDHQLFESSISKHGVSRYILAFAIYQLFLQKLTKQEDIVVGTPVTRRPEQRFEATVGMFVNTLPVRTFPAEMKTISVFIQEMKQTIIEVFNNADYSFDDLVTKLQLERDFSRNPIFDSMFVFQNFDIAENTSNEAPTFEFVSFGDKISRYDLSCVMFDFKDAINIHFEYNTSLFTHERITDYAQYFQLIWNYCLQQPQNTIQSIPNYFTKEMQAFASNSDTQGLEIEFNF